MQERLSSQVQRLAAKYEPGGEKQRPVVFTRAADNAEEDVENNQRQPAGHPAAKELPGDDLPPGNRLGQQRKDCAIFALGWDLPGGSSDGYYQRGNPNQQQTDVF